jgi:hypothetical protein
MHYLSSLRSAVKRKDARKVSQLLPPTWKEFFSERANSFQDRRSYPGQPATSFDDVAPAAESLLYLSDRKTPGSIAKNCFAGAVWESGSSVAIDVRLIRDEWWIVFQSSSANPKLALRPRLIEALASRVSHQVRTNPRIAESIGHAWLRCHEKVRGQTWPPDGLSCNVEEYIDDLQTLAVSCLTGDEAWCNPVQERRGVEAVKAVRDHIMGVIKSITPPQRLLHAVDSWPWLGGCLQRQD